MRAVPEKVVHDPSHWYMIRRLKQKSVCFRTIPSRCVLFAIPRSHRLRIRLLLQNRDLYPRRLLRSRIQLLKAGGQAAGRRGGGQGGTPARQIRLRVAAKQAPDAGAVQIRRPDGVDDGAAPGPAPLRRPPRRLGPPYAAARRRLPLLPGHRRCGHRHPRRRCVLSYYAASTTQSL